MNKDTDNKLHRFGKLLWNRRTQNSGIQYGWYKLCKVSEVR
jgi:hypothetical protein